MTARERVERPAGFKNLRLAVVAFIATFAILGGSGAAFAFWVATANVSTGAATATVGISQALSASSLQHTYTGTELAAVGVVTVTNSSTRQATYSTVVTASSSSSSFRSAVNVAVGTGTCTTTSTLANQVTGTFASPVTHTGTLAAGASVALCVRTTMNSAGVTANASAALAAAVATSATVGTWSTAASTAIGFTQNVVSAVVVDQAAWYKVTVLDPTRCAKAVGSGMATGGCSIESQYTSNRGEYWRFVPTGSGYYRVVSMASTNMNSSWWSAASTSVNAAMGISSATTTLQEWSLSRNANGTIAMKLRADPTKCAASSGNGNGAAMRIETCVPDDVDQNWTLDELGTATPPSVALTCTGDQFTRYFSWPALTYYQGEVTYRVFLNGVLDSTHTRGTGYDTTVQFGNLTTTAANSGGAGSKVVQVQQSVGGAPYTQVGTGTLVITSTGFLQCG